MTPRPRSVMRPRHHLLASGLLGLVAVLPLRSPAGTVEGLDTRLRLNQIQSIGTHNSYHLAPGEASAILLEAVRFDVGEGWTTPALNQALAYSHPPLEVQLQLGLRQFELDVYADPEGGRFTQPAVFRLREGTPWQIPVDFDPEGQLAQPGFKVFHHPEYDPRSTNYLLRQWVQGMMDWSEDHPGHFPLIVHIEAKQGDPKWLSPDLEPARVDKFDAATWRALEDEIRAIVPAEKLITPDTVRGEYRHLRDAIRGRGWPTLEELQGKILFFLLTKKTVTESYLRLNDELQGRLFFASVNPSHPAASWFRIPDPEYHRIPELLAEGFLITTVADQHSEAARANDGTRREAAFTSGSHFILTDFPTPNPQLSSYRVSFPGGRFQRANPVTGSVPAN